MNRRAVSSGSPYEKSIGFSRAVKYGDYISVSGTAPIWSDGTCSDDAEVQAMRCFEIISETLVELGATLRNVVRTRMYLVNAEDTAAVGRAHCAVFAETPPAATMVIVKELLDHRWKVEIEVDAAL